MTDSKSFVMVNLEMIQEYDLSFFEVGLLERIRYFSEYDQNGSGWCYVGKERLSKEFGISKPGLLKAIGRLIERNLLIRNDKGWLQVNLVGVNKVDCQLSLPVNKVSERSKLSLPNKNIKEDISNIDTSYSLLLSKQSLPPHEQSLPVNKVQQIRKKGKTYLDEASFDELMQSQGKQQVKIGYGLVYLKMSDYERFVKEFGKEMTHEMILQLDIYKGDNKVFSGKQRYVSDERVLRQSWVLRNAQQALSAKNSPVIQDIRKRERIAEEIRKNTEFFNPEPPQE